MGVSNRYRRWGNDSSKDCKYLTIWFAKKSNLQLATELGRTIESVRKQAKKMGLVRLKKTKIKGPPKKRGRKPSVLSIFDMVNMGHRNRNKKKRVVRKKEIRKRSVKKEQDWIESEFSEQEIRPCRDFSQSICVSIIYENRETEMRFSSPARMRRMIKRLFEKEARIKKEMKL